MRRRSDIEVLARENARDRSRDWAPWITKQAADLLAELRDLDGTRPSHNQRERLNSVERLMRLPAPRGMTTDQRASRLADAAGLAWPPEFHDQPTNQHDRGGRSQ